MKTNEAMDEHIRTLVKEGVEDIPSLDEAVREAVIQSVLGKIMPVCGGAAIRRQSFADMRAAFKEGFSVGKALGKYARWHTELFNRSPIVRTLRTATNDHGAAQSRYAHYNFD